MSFAVERDGDVTIVAVDGQLVVANRQAFKDLVLDDVAQGARQVVVDFANTGYIDSSGLGALVSIGKRLREVGGSLRIAGLNDDLRTLFELTRLDTLFALHPTRADALAGR